MVWLYLESKCFGKVEGVAMVENKGGRGMAVFIW